MGGDEEKPHEACGSDCGVFGLEVRFDEGVECFLIAQAGAFSDVFAVLEGDQGGDAAHVVLAGKTTGFVAVVRR